MSVPRILVVATAALAAAVLFAPSPAWAPVPPRNCGMLEERGKRFNIKADQLRCRTARRYLGGTGNDQVFARKGKVDRIGCGRGRDRVRADANDRVAGDCETVRH